MIRAGFTVDNPFAKHSIVVLESDAEIKGNGWLVEIRCQPKSRPDSGEHLHLTWTETFEIISGTAYYKLDGSQHTAQAGERLIVLPHHTHVHPWNAGDTVMVYRLSNQFEPSDPQTLQDVLGVLATVAGLARDGKVDNKGRPKHPLQLGATLKTLVKYGSYDASIPIPVQDFISATLGSLAEALGYKAVYPQYVN